MNTSFKSWMLSLALLVPVVACDDEDGGDDSAGDSANDSGNDGGGMTSSSEETCQSSHACINGVCQCETPTLEGMECTDNDECVDECEICM